MHASIGLEFFPDPPHGSYTEMMVLYGFHRHRPPVAPRISSDLPQPSSAECDT